MSDVVIYDKAWADSITERIRRGVESTGALILEAHTGKAWRHRGYATWEAYVMAEFNVTRTHSYRLLDVARATEAVQNVALGRQIDRPPTTKEAPAVVRQPDVVRDAIASGAPASEAYQAAVEAQRSVPRPDPKPGVRRGGFMPPVERARRMADELESWQDAIEPDVGIDRAVLRYVERIVQAGAAILAVGDPASRRPVPLADWRAG